MQRALEDAADGNAAEVVGVVEVRYQDLQRAFRVAGGGGNGLHDGFEERLQTLARLREVERSGALLGDGVKDREVELVFFRIEIDEQVVDLVQHFLGAGVGAVDLVDHHDRRQFGFQGLGQHVARLRKRAFGCVNQKHDAVDHFQGAFHFAAEIGVAGRVDDVDFAALEVDGGVLGEDGDAALALQLIRVHHSLGDLFVGAECAGLAQHGVDERGLAVVNVSDDGDIAYRLIHRSNVFLLLGSAGRAVRSSIQAPRAFDSGRLAFGEVQSSIRHAMRHLPF